MTLLDNDFTRYQMKSKLELFIKIGKCGKVDTPHEVYNSDGSLKVYPQWKAYISRTYEPSHREGCCQNCWKLSDVGNDADDTEQRSTKQSTKSILPKEVLLEFVKELLGEAARSGTEKISKRTERRLVLLISKCIDIGASQLIQQALERFSLEEYDAPEEGKCAGVVLSPERVLSSSNTSVVTPVTAHQAVEDVVDDTAVVTPATSLAARHPVGTLSMLMTPTLTRRILDHLSRQQQMQ